MHGLIRSHPSIQHDRQRLIVVVGSGPSSPPVDSGTARRSMPASRHQHQHQHQRLSTLATAAAATAAALLLLAPVSSAAHMYAPRRQGPAFAGSWLRAPHSAAARSSRSTLAAAAASATAHARRRPSSLGFLSAVTMLATPRGGWATTSTGGGIPTAPAATAGFCPAPLSTSATSSQTCLAASATSSAAASGATTVAAPVSATAKKTLQPKYRLSYRQPDYWIRHTDLTFQIEADPVSVACVVAADCFCMDRSVTTESLSLPSLGMDQSISDD